MLKELRGPKYRGILIPGTQYTLHHFTEGKGVLGLGFRG